MKILIVSDTHGRDGALKYLLEQVKPIDMLVHCGDVAVTTVRDANGDGKIYLNDVITTSYYLAGKYNPSSVKSFDFDGNGIISAMDSSKIQHYLLHNISDDGLPGSVGADSQAVATTRTYMRHYYNSSNPASLSWGLNPGPCAS